MTSYPTLVPEAKADVAAAFQWYEEKCLGLGFDFLRCVEGTLSSIQRAPLAYPIVHETYHRALVRRFPYAIFLDIDDLNHHCIVYSVFHCSQDPKKWRGRLQNNEL